MVTFQVPEELLAVRLNGLVRLLKIKMTALILDSESLTVALNKVVMMLKLEPLAGEVIFTVGTVLSKIVMLVDVTIAPSSYPSLGVACTVQFSPSEVSWATMTSV